MRACLGVLGAAILGTLLACSSAPRPAAAPVESRAPPPGAAPPSAPAAAAAAPQAATDATPPERARARWLAADWTELPGWAADRAAELWPALLAGCARPAAGWSQVCAQALLAPPELSDAGVRRWLMQQLRPWRLQAEDGQAEGLATGYYEPDLAAARTPQGRFRVPLYAPPAELLAGSTPRPPYYTRQQLDTLPQARAALQGRAIAWVEDPLDALVLQVQGSGRLRLTAPDGRVQRLRLAFAAHNEQPYRSLGRWLVEQGELTPEQASWPAIKSWAQRNPARVQELLWANPRVVFFREEALPDPTLGPRGAQGVPLTPGRSVAVDPVAVPLGTVLWLDSSEPLSARPLQQLALAQDSGGAITGAVRIDLFFGWGEKAQTLAGRMKQPLRLWALWPREQPPPAALTLPGAAIPMR